MNNEIATNIPQMQVNDFIQLITKIHIANANANNKKMLPSIMLWGAPGIGKSAAIKQVANKLSTSLNKKVVITDARLILFNPVDLRGIPTADVKKEFAIWLKPKIFDMNTSEDVINILFLDEITAAPQSVQAAAYQITLDRQVGEHKLPDNCIIFAAGNRITDKSVSYSMPKALSNRLTHIEIEPSVEDWKKWAISQLIDPRIVGFLGWKPNSLIDFDPKSQNHAFPTPRSWEMVDTYIKTCNDLKVIRPLIEGSIGIGATHEFIAFCKTFNKLPNVEAIADGKYTQHPTEPDICFALQSAIISFCTTKNPTPKQIKNIIKYCSDFTAEFAILCVKDMTTIDNIFMFNNIIYSSEWSDFAERYSDYF